MMRSMYSGVSSLRAHQVRMDVIGNNIANVNTVGYKGSKATFAEIYSQTVKGAGGSSTTRGGTNPQQIGLGIKLDSVNVSHTKGATQRTDNATDIMIDGNGFFVVSPTQSGTNKFYTRAGNFQVDELGYLVTSDGYFVIGEDGKSVRIDSTSTVGAVATDKITIGGNIKFTEKADPDNGYIAYSKNMDVYNSVGETQNLTIDFGPKLTTAPGTAVADTYSYRAVRINGNGNLNPTSFAANTASTGSAFDAADVYQANIPYFAKFDSKGDFLGFTDQLAIDANGYASGGNMIFENGSTDDLNITIQGAGVADIIIPLNYESMKNLKHYDQDTDIDVTPVTGRTAGNLDSYTIAANGQINMTFTNGESDSDQQIALADFDNPAGLLKVGSNRFIESPNSGTAKLGVPNAGSFGALTPGALEMSNVDLSAEFTDMITTQRGFQANSRVITTSDEILQELVSLKR